MFMNIAARNAGTGSRLLTWTVLLAVALLFSLTGIAAAQDQITVTHNQGETVVDVNPETVLTFDLASLSTLNALGIDVAGVPAFTFPESLAQYESDEYLKIGSLFEPDYEAVNAAEPDLIIVASRSAAVYPQLAEMAPTIDLTADSANFLESQQHNAEILGQIFDKEAEVEALWSDIEASVDAVRAATAEAGTSLIVMTSGGEVTAYGPGSRFGWIHDVLGFTPVIDDIEAATHGEAISFEFILEANPDWLIVVDRDVAIGQEADAAEQILDNELVAQTTAWQNGQVIYVQPSNWYVVAGGLGALQEMVDEFVVALDAEVAATAETAEANASEITVVHNQGETVVPVNPETVLTFDLATLSTLNALGIDVAGVPAFAFPESLAQYEGDEYLKIGSLFEPDYEAVNAAEPDLIIVAARSAAVYPQLAEMAPTIDLTADSANFLESQQHNAEILGQIFDKEAEATALWSDLEASIAEVQAQTAEAGTALIVMTSGGEVTAYGPGSRFGWIHDELGFTPVIEDIEAATHGEAISFEFILEANPDWLIVLDRDAAIGQEAEAAEQILDNELVAQTTAWANGQVIYLEPSNWYIVAGGLGALQEMVDNIGSAFTG